MGGYSRLFYLNLFTVFCSFYTQGIVENPSFLIDTLLPTS